MALKAHFQIRCAPELKERLEKLAAIHNRSMSNLAVTVLVDYIDREETRLGIAPPAVSSEEVAAVLAAAEKAVDYQLNEERAKLSRGTPTGRPLHGAYKLAKNPSGKGVAK